MEKGKIPYNSLIRSVLREPFIQHEKEHIGRDAHISGGLMSVTNTTVYGGTDAEALAFYRTMNGAWAFGIAAPVLQIALTLPVSEKESLIHERMKRLKALCDKESVIIAGGHTALSDQVKAPVITLTAAGNVKSGAGRRFPEEGDGLIIAGFPGDAGAYVLLNEEREKLEKRFSGAFLEGAEAFRNTFSAKSAIEAIEGIPACIHDISEGGIYAALWEMAEGFGTGFSVMQRSIPLHQETVEICELLGGNPYTLLSTGTLLISTGDTESVLSRLTDAGIHASLIGTVEEGPQKKLLRDDEIRYLDRPVRDSVMKTKGFG